MTEKYMLTNFPTNDFMGIFVNNSITLKNYPLAIPETLPKIPYPTSRYPGQAFLSRKSSSSLSQVQDDLVEIRMTKF